MSKLKSFLPLPKTLAKASRCPLPLPFGRPLLLHVRLSDRMRWLQIACHLKQKQETNHTPQAEIQCARKRSSPLLAISAPTTTWQTIAGHNKNKSNKESRSSKPPSGECISISKQHTHTHRTTATKQGASPRSAMQTSVTCKHSKFSASPHISCFHTTARLFCKTF